MKIGILTYHRTLNYGACLQALAIRLLLEKMGHEVYYVDYWPDYHQRMYSIFSWNTFVRKGLKGKISYIVRFFKKYKYKKERIDCFDKFHKTHTYPYCKPVIEQYDAIIYGSDQIWRKQKDLDDFNPWYFASNKKSAKKHISYSASMGKLPTESIDIIKIKNFAANFDSISVREQDLCDFLIKLGYKDTVQTVDPTLLLGMDIWRKMLPSKPKDCKKYVLVYALWDNIFDMDQVSKFAKNIDCEVRVIRGEATTPNSYYNITSADPFEFLSLISNAEYVFPSSFHGTVFSIIFEKQFYASIQVNSSRITSLLDLAGLSNRFLPPLSVIPENPKNIDYSIVKNKLKNSIELSLNYLCKAIE